MLFLLIIITQYPDFQPTFNTILVTSTFPILWNTSLPCKIQPGLIFLSISGTPWTRFHRKPPWYLFPCLTNEDLSPPRNHIPMLVSTGSPSFLTHMTISISLEKYFLTCSSTSGPLSILQSENSTLAPIDVSVLDNFPKPFLFKNNSYFDIHVIILMSKFWLFLSHPFFTCGKSRYLVSITKDSP